MNFPAYATLALEMVEPHVLLIKLNRPEVANAINTQMGHDMLDLWRRLTDDSGDVRCAILTGAGDKIFCAGGDLKERNGMTKQQWVAQHELFERAYWTLVEVPVPIIAAINGHAYAGGLETALACDFLYAANTARFALTEVSIGIMPGGGGTQNLPRAVGERRAKEIILTAKPFSAQQAAEWGLVNRICEPAELMPAALETARAIAGNAPLSVRQAKKSIHFGLQMELKTAYRFEVEAYNHLVETEDRYEGIRAFNEKRKPVFKGK
ncbi:MAG: enoyl-CoA hydratase/isomerase family protein [Betaproteobacteria bacterium]|nr:enoyl-CoA hydratase/isomerase family protein [Betaproteobacteria bacterium]